MFYRLKDSVDRKEWAVMTVVGDSPIVFSWALNLTVRADSVGSPRARW